VSATNHYVAWKGSLDLKLARWDSSNGYTAQFSIPEDSRDAERANPFKHFTKMRKGRVGTRFEAVIVDAKAEDPETVYASGVMLKGWTDSNSGQTVTFWLAHEAGGDHPLVGFLEGHPFAVALIELQDDDTPVDQVSRERAESVPQKRERKLSNYVAMMVKSPQFLEYIRTMDPTLTTATQADLAMKVLAGITSKTELDTDPEAASRFHERVRRPYANWCVEHGYE